MYSGVRHNVCVTHRNRQESEKRELSKGLLNGLLDGQHDGCYAFTAPWISEPPHAQAPELPCRRKRVTRTHISDTRLYQFLRKLLGTSRHRRGPPNCDAFRHSHSESEERPLDIVCAATI